MATKCKAGHFLPFWLWYVVKILTKPLFFGFQNSIIAQHILWVVRSLVIIRIRYISQNSCPSRLQHGRQTHIRQESLRIRCEDNCQLPTRNSELFQYVWDLKSNKGGLKLWCIVAEVISSMFLSSSSPTHQIVLGSGRTFLSIVPSTFPTLRIPNSSSLKQNLRHLLLI